MPLPAIVLKIGQNDYAGYQSLTSPKISYRLILCNLLYIDEGHFIFNIKEDTLNYKEVADAIFAELV